MDNNKIPATQAAQHAQISRERLMRRVQTGEIKGELIAGRWLIDVGSLERFLSKQPQLSAVRSG